jgi:hypothetical protein
MTKLNQVLAVEKGVKRDVYARVTELYQKLQKPTLLTGISRTYRPKDEDGDLLPAESTKLQLNAEDVLREVFAATERLFDVTFAKDGTNTRALADIVVDGEVLVPGVPVPYLLFLEKQLTDLHSIIFKLPVLDPAENWTYDANVGAYATAATETTRTKKIPRNHVKAPPTDKHPAQVEVYYEDVIVGYWKTVKFSGALPATRINELLGRVAKLQQAVKFAREQANGTDVVETSVGRPLLGYIFNS